MAGCASVVTVVWQAKTPGMCTYQNPNMAHLGEAQQRLDAVHGAVEHGEEQDGQRGEHDVEGGRRDVVHHGLPAVAAVELRQAHPHKLNSN